MRVTLLGTLVDGFVLMVLPAFVARAATVVCLGAGAGLLLLAFRLAERPDRARARVGSRPPRRLVAGRIAGARCFGDLVTLEPTGVVLVRAGARRTLGDLFRAWGQPLTRSAMAGFAASPGRSVAVYVGGRRRPGP